MNCLLDRSKYPYRAMILRAHISGMSLCPYDATYWTVRGDIWALYIDPDLGLMRCLNAEVLYIVYI